MEAAEPLLGDGDHDQDDEEPGSVASSTNAAGEWDAGEDSRPAFRSVVADPSSVCEEFLYELKAGPAGGRLRRPSSAGSTCGTAGGLVHTHNMLALSEIGRQGRKMSAAFFALAGTLLGVLGTALVTLLNKRAEDRRTSREALRAVCTDLTTNLMRVRQLCMEMYDDGYQEQLWDEANRLLADAQAAYERFRIVADLVATQKAARLCVHHCYWLSRSVGKNPRGDWQEEHDALNKWMAELLKNVRRELGVRHFRSLYMDPREDRPEPPVKQPKEGRITNASAET